MIWRHGRVDASVVGETQIMVGLVVVVLDMSSTDDGLAGER